MTHSVETWVVGLPERACMDYSSLARCSGGILASTSGGMSIPADRVVRVISQASGLALKESASAGDAIPGMTGLGMSPTTVSITELLSAQTILVLRFAVRRLGIEAAHANHERYGTKNHTGH